MWLPPSALHPRAYNSRARLHDSNVSGRHAPTFSAATSQPSYRRTLFTIRCIRRFTGRRGLTIISSAFVSCHFICMWWQEFFIPREPSIQMRLVGNYPNATYGHISRGSQCGIYLFPVRTAGIIHPSVAGTPKFVLRTSFGSCGRHLSPHDVRQSLFPWPRCQAHADRSGLSQAV